MVKTTKKKQTKKQGLYLSNINPVVIAALDKKAKETGIDKRLLVEKILQDVLGIKRDFDVKKWLNNL